MSRAKTERLLNLVICLLAAPRYLSKEEIRRAVPGYSEAPEAFERAFERDKEDLREMGVPVETGSNSAWFEDEIGYRIRRDAYALPDVRFTADEMAVLALAAHAWQQGLLAGPAAAALQKLRAAGVETQDVSLAGIEPRVNVDEPAFWPLWQAVRDRRPVRFEYRRPAGEPGVRTVEPWGIVSWHGHWYLVGHDRDRSGSRVFRLNRISSPVSPVGQAGTVQVPEGLDVRAVVVAASGATAGGVRAGAASDDGPSGRQRPAEPVVARIALAGGSGGFLRRRGQVVAREGGRDLLEVPFADAEQLADDVVGLGADALVVGPDSVRDAVVRRLRAVLDAAAGSALSQAAGDPSADPPGGPSADPPGGPSADPPGSAGAEQGGGRGQEEPTRPGGGTAWAAADSDTAAASGPGGTGSGGAVRLARLLALVPYLLANPGARVSEVARLFGIGERRLADDLNLLFVCGLPGHLPDDLIDVEVDGGGISVSNADTLARPLRLGTDEALALLVGLRTLREVRDLIPGLPEGDALERATAKLERTATDAAQVAASITVHVEPAEQVAGVVRESLERGRRLHLVYYVPGRDETTERDVDPMRLHVVEGRTYLEAWCRRAEDVRLFRLDRVAEVSLLDVPAQVPEGTQGRDLTIGLFSPSAADALVTLELAPGAHWVADYYPCEQVDRDARARLVVSLRTPDFGWVVRLLLRLGGTARALAPVELVRRVGSAAEAALQGYETSAEARTVQIRPAAGKRFAKG